MEIVTAPVAVARRPRAFVRVWGPQATDYLNRMVSNDVVGVGAGRSCDALLLTPKARVVATLRVVRRAEDDYLLLTEPELGAIVRDHLLRTRFAAKTEIELEQHDSHLLFGLTAEGEDEALVVPNSDYGMPAAEVIGRPPPQGLPELDEDTLERMRIEAGTPRFGREIDERVLPAEAGLEERAISFTKGCYPGQEPVARLHFRGHPNRALRVLRIESEAVPEPDTEILYAGKSVGRVTSAALAGGGVIALGYVRVEVPLGVELKVGDARATMAAPRARS